MVLEWHGIGINCNVEWRDEHIVTVTVNDIGLPLNPPPPTSAGQTSNASFSKF